MSLVRLVPAALCAALTLASAVPAAAGTVVEYYHKDLDHYFVTGLPQEIQALDGGQFAGWARTGFSFETYAATDSRAADAVPVCRFYGNPARGLDSHFYSASPAECAEVKAKWPEEWLLETDDLFRVHAVNPNTGTCPSGTKAVYRLWNKRSDVNHRYTTDAAIVDSMLTKGYVLEGNGSPQRPIAFCAANVAPAQTAAGAPVCTITSGTPFPTIGTPVTLTATCTNSPTTYAWANCTGTGNTCTAASNAVGKLSYSLVATNALGASAPAAIELDWQVAASAAPLCTVAASSATPQLGTALTLTATCTRSPTQFQWLGCSALLVDVCNPLSECSSSSTTCRPIASQVGAVFYAVVARNSAGPSAKSGVAVDWVGGGQTVAPPPPPSPTPSCVIAPSSSTPAVNTTLTLTASCSNSPTGYSWTGCASTGSTCAVTETSAGTRSYGVTARNAAGTGPAAQVTVTWQQPPTAPPSCTISASTATPYVGGSVTLTANCSQSPTGFQWTNCNSSSATCTATSTQTGPATYSVAGVNQFGPGQAASTTVTWGTPPPAGADFCGQYANVNYVNLPWGGYIDTHANGGFHANGVLVGRIRVPANATGTGGLVSVVEYIDGQARRIMSISPSACDFRGFTPGVGFAVDPAGEKNPLGWGAGINPNVFYGISGSATSGIRLDAGRTYYVNIRNIDFDTGQSSCRTATCNVRMTLNTPR